MSVPENFPGDRSERPGAPSIGVRDVPCPLCGSVDADVLFEAVDRLHDVQGRFRYVRCRDCGLVYMNPQVTPECLGSLYPAQYGPHADKAKSPRKKWFELRERIAKIPLVGRQLRSLMDARVVDPLLGRLDPERRLLDVGCGNGLFLDTMRRATGCHVCGIDLSPIAVERAKGLYELDIFEGSVAQAPFPDEYFDAVTAWWYLEHVPDPQEVMAHVARLLKPGGLCAIGVPNADSCWAKTFKDKWYHLDCPRHLCLWSPATIKRLLKDHGLSVRKIFYDRTPWGLLGSLQYKLYGDNRDPRTKNRIRQSVPLAVLCLPVTLVVSLLHRSDIMTVFAEKRSAGDAGGGKAE